MIEKQQRKQEKAQKKALNIYDSEGEDDDDEEKEDNLNTVDWKML